MNLCSFHFYYVKKEEEGNNHVQTLKWDLQFSTLSFVVVQ